MPVPVAVEKVAKVDLAGKEIPNGNLRKGKTIALPGQKLGIL
jgi:hypothetical protein